LIIELQSLTKIRSKEWINAQPVRLDSDYMYFDEVEITATALWAAIEGYDSFDEIVVGCVGSTPIMAFALAMIAAINASNTSYVRTLIDGQEPIDASELRHTFGRRRRKAQ
jgi:hypothetical protein